MLRAGYTVIKLWECEWDRLVDTDETVQQFVRSFDLIPPIDPREAFFEGPYRCCGWRGRGDTLCGCHVFLSLGQQKLYLPHRSSADHHPAWRSIHPLLFWSGAGGHSSPPPDCFIPCCPSVVVRNSPFHSAAVVSGKNRPNPCWKAPITATIRMLIECCAGPGARPSWSKPWPRGTLSTASMKSEISLPTNYLTDMGKEEVVIKKRIICWLTSTQLRPQCLNLSLF